MDPAAIKDWLVPLATFVALITGSIGGWLSLKEYRLKVKAETRVARSAELESDIKLLKLFTEIMTIAHARGGTAVSEKAIERILSPEMLKELGVSAATLQSAIGNAVINLPVGVAAQDSAICAIWVLGNRHEILRPVAIQALTSLSGFKSIVAAPYLDDLKRDYGGPVLAHAEYQKSS